MEFGRWTNNRNPQQCTVGELCSQLYKGSWRWLRPINHHGFGSQKKITSERWTFSTHRKTNQTVIMVWTIRHFTNHNYHWFGPNKKRRLSRNPFDFKLNHQIKIILLHTSNVQHTEQRKWYTSKVVHKPANILGQNLHLSLTDLLNLMYFADLLDDRFSTYRDVDTFFIWVAQQNTSIWFISLTPHLPMGLNERSPPHKSGLPTRLAHSTL